MGAGQSELKSSLDRLPSLRGKPGALKDELSQFVAVCPLDQPMNVKIDKKVFDIMHELFTAEMNDPQASPFDQMTMFQALQRFMKIRMFYINLSRADLSPYVTAIKRSDPIALNAALNTIAWMLDCRVTPEPGNRDFDRDKEEAAVKYAFYEYKGYDALCSVLVRYGNTDHTQLVSRVLDMLSLDLTDHLHTTRFHITQRIIKLLTPHCEVLLDLTTNPNSLEMRCFTMIFMTSLLLQSPLRFVASIQERVLKQGYLLYYMMFSIDANGINKENSYWALYDKSQTMLARKFLSLLCSGHAGIRSVVLGSIPVQLHGAIEEPVESRAVIKGAGKSDKSKLEETLWFAFQSGRVVRVNCEPLFGNLDDEIKLPHIIWVARMKAELLDQLRQEVENFQIAQTIAPSLIWQHDAFEVTHPYLEKYCRVGNFYVSLLISALQNHASGYVLRPEMMQQLLSALFQRAVVEDDPAWKLACMGAISTMYERYPQEFHELLIIPYYIYLLQPVRVEPIWRDHILRFMQAVLREASNAKRFLDYGGVEPLIHFINHIHTLESPDDNNIADDDEADEMPALDKYKSLSVQLEQKEVQQINRHVSSSSEDNGNDSSDEEDDDDNRYARPGNRGRAGRSYDSSPEPEHVLAPPSNPPAPPPPPPPAPVSAPPPPRQPQPPPPAHLTSQIRTAPSPPPANARRSSPSPSAGGKSSPAPPKLQVPFSPIPSAASGANGSTPTISPTSAAALAPVTGPNGEPIKVQRAGELKPKTQAEHEFDWSDEKEDLKQGLPPEFSPEEIAARSVRLLRIIAYGGAKLRRALTTPKLLSCLVKLLLCPVMDIREDGLRMLLDLLATSPHVIPWLAPTGLFPFIIYSLRFGCSPNLAKLIDRTHLHQAPQFVEPGQSALNPFLPATLISILKADGADALRVAMESDTSGPDMIWNDELKLFMHDSINQSLTYFIQQLRRNPDTQWPETQKPLRIEYKQLQQELNIGGIYLKPLNAFENDIGSVSLREPAPVMQQLTKAIASKKYKDVELDTVLLSSIIVANRYKELDELRVYKQFAPLFALIDPEDKSSASIIGKQSEEWAAPLQSRAALLLNSLLKIDGGNAQAAFDSKGLDHLGSTITALAVADLSGDSDQSQSRIVTLIHSMEALSELVKRVPTALKQIEHDTALLKSIVRFIHPRYINALPEAAITAAKALTAAAKNDKALDTLVKQGGLVYAIHGAVFFGQLDPEQQAISPDDLGLNNSVRTTLLALVDLIKVRGNKRTAAIVAGLLTAEGLNATAQPSEFLRFVDSLDEEFKGRLMGYLLEQTQAIDAIDGEDWREYSDNNFTFQ